MIRSVMKSHMKEGAHEKIIHAISNDIVHGGKSVKPNLMDSVGIPAELYES